MGGDTNDELKTTKELEEGGGEGEVGGRRRGNNHYFLVLGVWEFGGKESQMGISVIDPTLPNKLRESLHARRSGGSKNDERKRRKDGYEF